MDSVVYFPFKISLLCSLYFWRGFGGGFFCRAFWGGFCGEDSGVDSVVDVFFRQTYSSNTYKDVTEKVLRMTKVLRMRKEDSDWKILIERAR